MEQVKQDIKDLINLFEQLIAQEDFPAYTSLRDKYKEAFSILNISGSTLHARKKISFTSRMFMEAPPKDKELGLKIITLIDKIYKSL